MKEREAHASGEVCGGDSGDGERGEDSAPPPPPPPPRAPPPETAPPPAAADLARPTPGGRRDELGGILGQRGG